MTIIKQDAIDFLHEFEDNSIDLLLTDIPYNVVNRKSNGLRNLDKKDADPFNLNLYELLELIHKKTKGSIYIFCATEQISEIRSYFAEKKLSTRTVVWEKTNPSPMNGQHLWLSSIELCVFAKKKNAVFNEYCKSSVLRYPTVKNKRHPTEKSLQLFKKIIETSSNENDLVVDPFCGSGTTAVAAKLLNRRFKCCDINDDYISIAKERINEEK